MEKEPMLCVLLLHPNARASDPRSGSDQKGRVHPSDQVEISVLALRMTAILDVRTGLHTPVRSNALSVPPSFSPNQIQLEPVPAMSALPS